MSGQLRRRARAAVWPVGAIAVYIAVAVVAFSPVDPASSTDLVGCACSDAAQEVWFLAWPAYAISHGANPFFSGLINYPAGVNLALNTSMPLLGLLASPLTLLAGPIEAFNLMLRLSFAASATSMLFVVRRFTTFWPAAFLAGLLYGFSPYMVGQGFGHLFLTFVPLPPLIALVVYEICRRPSASVLRLGLALGLLCVAQFLISIEVLVATGICVGVVMLVAALRHRDVARARLAGVARGLGTALAVFTPLIAYPLWFFLEGPGHVVGPTHDVANIAPVKADLLSVVVPSLNQRIGTAQLLSLGTSFSGGDRPEIGSYLGIPLLVLLAALAWRYRRDPALRLGAALALTGLVLALGSPLVVDGHRSAIPLPFDVLLHLPLLQGMVAARFSLFEQLGAAVVLGVGIDRVARAQARPAVAETVAGAGGSEPPPGPSSPRPQSRSQPRPRWRRRPRWRPSALPAPALALVLGLVGLVPLLPRYPYVSTRALVPGYFDSGASDAIPQGSVVLTYPYDVDPDNEAMLWQAVAGMRFAIFGGQAARPGAGGAVTSAVAQLEPATVQQLWRAAMYGSGPSGAAVPAADASTYIAIRAFCRRYGVGTIVVAGIGVDPSLVVRYVTAAFGRSPVAERGAAVWYDVGESVAPGRSGSAQRAG